MARVTVDVNDKSIDKAVREELKRLQRRVSTLELSVARWKGKVKDQQKQVETAKRIVSLASHIADKFGRSEWDE